MGAIEWMGVLAQQNWHKAIEPARGLHIITLNKTSEDKR